MIETSDMQFDSRMVTAEETPEDHDVEVTLRPQTLAMLSTMSMAFGAVRNPLS